MHQLLQRIAPECPVEKASYDDYYIDVTQVCLHLAAELQGNTAALHARATAAPNVHAWGSEQAWNTLSPAMWAGTQIALDIRQSLHASLGFTVSVGVACGRVGARLAGPLYKPDCVVVVPHAAHRAFLLSRPLLDIPSLG